MLFHFYAFCVAAVLIDCATSTPVPQILPTNVCPPTHYLYNGACFLQASSTQQNAIAVAQPCTSCQTSNCQTASPCHQAVSSGFSTTALCQATSSCTNAVSTCCTQPQCHVTCNQACTTTTNCATACQQQCPTCVNQCCYNQNQCCGCPPTTPSPPITPTTTTTPTPPTTPAPPTTTSTPKRELIITCPIGTILINGYCHLIYCGSGTLRNGKCIVTVCPDGAIWTGSKCEVPAPQNQTTLNISNLFITNVNQTNIEHIVNHENNLNIYITESSDTEVVTVSPNTTKCCTIVTPVTCIWNGSRHNCTSRKYRRCGSMCTNIYIYLQPPMIVPRPEPPCIDNCVYDDRPSFYPDCTTCNRVRDVSCWSYCQRSVCETSTCHSVELRGYCGSYPGSIGCRRMDGCINDWCSDY